MYTCLMLSKQHVYLIPYMHMFNSILDLSGEGLTSSSAPDQIVCTIHFLCDKACNRVNVIRLYIASFPGVLFSFSIVYTFKSL